jgi:competence protein ComEC
MQIKVVSPTGSDLLWQTGSSPPGVRVFTANAMSAVVMVVVDTRTEVLLAADAGDSTFRRMLAAGVDLRAPVLVFPHHGGRPGSGDPSTFAADVCSAVAPEVVIFSVGRARDGFPRQEVVSAVRATVPNAHVACTQLTTHCASKVPPADPAHIHVLSAAGRLKRSCCAGTVEFSYPVGAGSQMLPTVAEHRQFVLTEATTRMCN